MSDREAMKLALEALEWAWGGEPMGTKEQAAMQALRAALAAEPTKPERLHADTTGVLLGSKWVVWNTPTGPNDEIMSQETADLLNRIFADAEALRRDAERYRWIRDNHEIKGRAMEIVYNSNGKEWDADIDWAMREDKT